jgi:zinc transport system ATP-binding protein
MTTALVTLRNLRVVLGGKEILSGVDADIVAGQITALIGLNGSGKTTLLRAILKEIPYTGTIAFHCGHDHRRPMPQHVGYVPQRLRIDANLPLTVRDLLALALQTRPLFLGVSRKVERQMVELMLSVFLSPELLNQYVEKLSGGELQRVLLGLAMQPEPELLLLDEPASGIDFQHEKGFYNLIGQLNKEKHVTIVLVSHDLTVVSSYADHVLCLKDGRIQCQGHPRETLNGEILAQTFGAEKGFYSHSHELPQR